MPGKDDGIDLRDMYRYGISWHSEGVTGKGYNLKEVYVSTRWNKVYTGYGMRRFPRVNAACKDWHVLTQKNIRASYQKSQSTRPKAHKRRGCYRTPKSTAPLTRVECSKHRRPRQHSSKRRSLSHPPSHKLLLRDRVADVAVKTSFKFCTVDHLFCQQPSDATNKHPHPTTSSHLYQPLSHTRPPITVSRSTWQQHSKSSTLRSCSKSSSVSANHTKYKN
jgi:sensor c-di-GMP phosphodiesterase-like protein